MILMIVGACAFAVQMLIAKMMVAEIHPNILVCYRVGIGALIITFWTLLTGKADFGVEASYWLVTLLGAFIGPCASFLLTFRSYRYWDLSRSSMVKTAEPLFVLPLSYGGSWQAPEWQRTARRVSDPCRRFLVCMDSLHGQDKTLTSRRWQF